MVRTRSGKTYSYDSDSEDETYDIDQKLVEEDCEKARKKFLKYEKSVLPKISYLDFMNILCIFTEILWERLYPDICEIKCSEPKCRNMVVRVVKGNKKKEDISAYIIDTDTEMNLICRSCYDKKIKSGDIYIPKKIKKNPAIKKGKHSQIRQEIPPKLKTNIWKNRFGSSSKGKCHICTKDITKTNCQLGHNVPHSICKDYTKLIPICSKCNISIHNNYSIDFMANIVFDFITKLDTYY